MSRSIFAMMAIAAVGCGGSESNNSASNNGGSNNGASNNGGSNNGTDNNGSNNGTSNNGTNNNGTNNTNNAVTNRFGLAGDCRLVSVDNLGNGSVDEVRVEQATDPAYQTLSAWVGDGDGDGEFDFATKSTFDNDGRVETQDIDNDGDGDYEWHVVFTYDADGNTTSMIVTDGVGELFVATSTFDANGNLLTHTEDGSLEGAERTDGTPEYRETRTYVGTIPSLIEVDADGDGTPEMRQSREFNSDGKWTSRTRDGSFDFGARAIVRPMDGIPDEQEAVTYGADGSPTSFTSDGDVGRDRAQADGVLDLIQRNMVWSNDRLTSWEQDGRVDVTNDITTEVADGNFDAYRMTWDANGNRTSWILDEGMDGTDDVVERQTYDANGMLLTFVRDGVVDNDQIVHEPADGVDDWVQTLTWHAPGYVASFTVDEGADGVNDYVVEVTYADTSYGVVMTSEKLDGGHYYNDIWRRADGTWDRERTVTLDDQERLKEQRFVQNGAVESLTTWEYGSCSDFL